MVVCSGVKSILHVGATPLEVLESASVTPASYRCDSVPCFYVAATRHEAPWRFDSPAEAAAAYRSGRALGLEGGLCPDEPPNPALHSRRRRAARGATRAAAARSVSGKEVTPFLLAEIARLSDGRTLALNKALVRGNARLGTAIAQELTTEPR